MFVDEFLGFNIYLHDRGQFWPGLEMGKLFKSMVEQTTLRIEITKLSSLQAELGWVMPSSYQGTQSGKEVLRCLDLYSFSWLNHGIPIKRCGRRLCWTRMIFHALRWTKPPIWSEPSSIICLALLVTNSLHRLLFLVDLIEVTLVIEDSQKTCSWCWCWYANSIQ